jgi:Protein of unknown function (DUF3105)
MGKPRGSKNRSAIRREQRERAKRKSYSGSSKARLWWGIGSGLVIAIVVVILVISNTTNQSASKTTPTPPPTTTVKPAGVVTFPEPNRKHVSGNVIYDRVPPAGGNHNPVWLNCGIYDKPVPNVHAVHSLEHGTVWITYRPSLAKASVQKLRTLVQSEYSGTDRYVLLSPYPGLPSPIVATAWGNQLFLKSASDPRIKQFIEYFRLGPQDLEPGALCSGGVGNPIG